MGRNILSDDAYTSEKKKTDAKGSATHRGEQRHKEGKGLDPLVDPKGFGVIRRSLNRYVPDGKYLVLASGVAMLKETRFDTTGSMGDNVNKAFDALPKSYKLLTDGEMPVLGRYDTQIITSIFGDVSDSYVLCRSQAEMDVKIAEQMTLMVPERAGGDPDEDPQYGLFGAAYLTSAVINKYGLKSYDFTVSDANGRDWLDLDTLKRVFGDTVLEKVAENGCILNKNEIPSTAEVVKDLQKRAHAFFLQVGVSSEVTGFWTNIFGKQNVVMLPHIELLPEIEAAIIGLTEGVLTLQTLENYLVTEAKLSKAEATSIKRAVAHIPLGAQAALPNFDKIPAKGTKFTNKTDLWPIADGAETTEDVSVKKKDIFL